MKVSTLGFVNGLLGTIILHLLVLIVFFAAKITGISQTTTTIQIINPETFKKEVLEKLENQEKAEKKRQMLDKMADAFISGQMRKNTGVNVADKTSPTTDKELQQVQEEIEAARKQQADIQQNLDNADKLLSTESDLGKPVPKKHTEKIQGKKAVFKGPTNISYDLIGRNDVSLPIPVYKCQGNGRVVVIINVNQAGEVESASIDKSLSDLDDCLFEAALKAAKKTKFNADFAKAPLKQKGTITYLFVAQ